MSWLKLLQSWSRSSPPKLFLGKGDLKICSKFTGEHPYRRVISIKFLYNFIEITLWHGCSPVNLLHIFRTPFPKNTSGGLLLLILKLTCHNIFDKLYTIYYETSILSILKLCKPTALLNLDSSAKVLLRIYEV